VKLLIVTPIFPPRTGGPATYVWELTKRLKEKHTITIICFSPNPKSPDSVIVHSVPEYGNSLVRQLRLLKSVVDIGKGSDCVYIQGPLVVGLVTTTVGKLMGKRVVLKFVGDEGWESAQISGSDNRSLEEYLKHPRKLKQKIKLTLENLSLHFANQIITPSQYLKDILTTHYQVNPKKVALIPNAVETEVIDTNIKKKKYQLITVGRLVPWKNIDKIMKAIALARTRYPWKLVVVGEGPEELKLKKVAKSLKGDGWITFTSRVSQEDTLKKIAESQKLILYSDYEGLSHTLIEALLLNIPIITSDIRANRETVETHATFVPLNNISALHHAINQPVKLSPKAQLFALDQYSWKSHINSLLKCLKTYEKEN